jgi:hemoglobin
VPTAEDTPWQRIGGADGVKALVEAFYDTMEQREPELTAVHQLDAPGKVSRQSRDHFISFLNYWLGGPEDYLTVRGHPRLRARHGRVAVTIAQRDAWLRCMTRAMDSLSVSGGVRQYLDKRFSDVADFLRNVQE